MWHLHVPFAYEPVGPKAFPILLAVLMALCCGVLLAAPDRDTQWPHAAVLAKGALLIVVLLTYASLFEALGFPLATGLMVIALSRLFGASLKAGLISGVLVGVLGYIVFDRLLEVSLPLGRLWGLG
ncbi:MAG TPA: tripartite tricarboxylate transporter TctB family protein, partial [Pseudomonadales bacterium]|nr:tripartite tricarboxylate transporter TctB family protein [Pseudomonadales bacterium]